MPKKIEKSITSAFINSFSLASCFILVSCGALLLFQVERLTFQYPNCRGMQVIAVHIYCFHLYCIGEDKHLENGRK